MVQWGIWMALAVFFAPLGWAQLHVSGNFNSTLRVLPTVGIQESELTLKGTIAGLRVESESTFYHDGLRYQSFYLSGTFGQFNLGGRVSFHAQDVRYRKAWISAEMKHNGGLMRLTVNHWSALGEYTSSDRDKFGPWPCSNTVFWYEAWRHIGRVLYVQGPVVGYEHTGPLRLYVGRPSSDPDRFDVYISVSNLLKFEEAFGARFWESWVGKAVCVQGTIKGYRWTSGGPRDGGYSVAEVAVSSPSNLSSGGCCGYPTALSCPGSLTRWFNAHLQDGEMVWVQGPVVSITGPAKYHGYEDHYRVRIGGGATVANRVEVILPNHPGWPTASSSYSREVCVYGKVTVTGGVAVILPPDLIATRDEPCCTANLLPGVFINQRIYLRWDPFTITVDLWDCCAGFGLGRVTAVATGLPAFCCGLVLDASVTFSACRGTERLALEIRSVSLACCDLVAEIGVVLTLETKTVSLAGRWPRVSGCITLYGDVIWTDHGFSGLALYGWGITCALDRGKLRLVTALDPDAVESMTDVTFYAHEFEYAGITSTGPGCCGGAVSWSAELWFGTKGILFGLQRIRLKLDVPVSPNVTAFIRGQWNFVKAEPLEWFDLGCKIWF